MKKLTIGVIFGGRSGEHEVSLVSATSVIAALNRRKYRVVPIGITKAGAWITEGNPLQRLKQASRKPSRTEAIITPDTTRHGLTVLRKTISAKRIDVVMPVLHGTFGEDGTVQGLLELAGLPYVGSPVLGSAVCMDKIIQKQLCERAGIPVVRYASLNQREFMADPVASLRSVNALRYPLFVKPANLGSSVGITKAHDRKELRAALALAFSYDRWVIVEEAVTLGHEVEIAILGNEQPRASVIGEIIAGNEFYDYDAKYVDGSSQLIIPAPLPSVAAKQVTNFALQAFTVCRAAGLARIDFLVDRRNRVFLNEINTMPGFTEISMYPKLWSASGLPYPQLLDRLISLARERFRQTKRLRTTYQPKTNWHQQ